MRAARWTPSKEFLATVAVLVVLAVMVLARAVADGKEYAGAWDNLLDARSSLIDETRGIVTYKTSD